MTAPQTIHHYKFNETSGETASDTGSSANNLTRQNSGAFGNAGVISYCFTAPQSTSEWGALYSSTRNDLGSGDFSLCFWLKAQSGETSIFLDNGGNVSGRWGIKLVSDKLEFLQSTGAGTAVVDDDTDRTGSWAHYCIVRSSGTTYLYVNGNSTPVDSASDSFNYTTASGNIRFSYFSSSSKTHYWDDMRWYNVALSTDQIATLYNSGSGTEDELSDGITTVKLNIGDDWKTPTAVSINIGDVWKTVSSLKVNIGDAWKTII